MGLGVFLALLYEGIVPYLISTGQATLQVN